MPTKIDTILYITEHTELPVKNYFLVEAIGVSRPTYQSDEIPYQLVGFYPKDPSIPTQLERFSNGDVIRISGKFIILDKDSLNYIKVLLANVNVLPIEPQDLPKVDFSISLMATVTNNPSNKDNKIIITVATNEYMDSNTKTMNFNVYVHLTEEHLIKTVNSVTRGNEVFVAGNLELSEQGLVALHVTQLAIIVTAKSSTPTISNQKNTNYAWASSSKNSKRSRNSSNNEYTLTNNKIPKLAQISINSVNSVNEHEENSPQNANVIDK